MHEGHIEDGTLVLCGVCAREVYTLSERGAEVAMCDECSYEGWKHVAAASVRVGDTIAVSPERRLVVTGNPDRVGTDIWFIEVEDEGVRRERCYRGGTLVYARERV